MKPGDDDGGAEARRAILARRAKFVTVALAGVGLAAIEGCQDSPRPCLNVTQVPEPSATPVACLDVKAPRDDAGAEQGSDAGGDPADAGVRPSVCLEIAPPPPPPPPPRVCLSPPRQPPKGERGF